MAQQLNLNVAQFSSGNPLDIPELNANHSQTEGIQWMRFSDAVEVKEPDRLHSIGIHFYEDDARMERVWNFPNTYLPLFRNCAAVLSPDFSLYFDMPLVLQMYNKYRNHWCGKFWAFHNINVIPSINLSTEDIWHLTKIGIPEHSVLATSTIGLGNSAAGNEYLLKKIEFIKETFKPERLLVFTRSNRAFQGCEMIRLPFRGFYYGTGQ